MTQTHVSQARDSIVEARHALGEAIAHLEDADASRVVAKAEVDDLRKARRELTASLERMPKA